MLKGDKTDESYRTWSLPWGTPPRSEDLNATLCSLQAPEIQSLTTLRQGNGRKCKGKLKNDIEESGTFYVDFLCKGWLWDDMLVYTALRAATNELVTTFSHYSLQLLGCIIVYDVFSQTRLVPKQWHNSRGRRFLLKSRKFPRKIYFLFEPHLRLHIEFVIQGKKKL